MKNLFHDCIKLTIALDQKLKDPEEKKKLEEVSKDLYKIINKNFPDMVNNYVDSL
mgnify:CR=1 FL=1